VLAASDDVETAALSLGLFDPHIDAALPRPLTGEDGSRYQRIFRFQQEQRWTAADQEILRLDNHLLLGHVLAQRYLAPAYRAKYAELAEWLDHYADLPEAPGIYSLASKRMPRGAHAPRRPEGTVFSVATTGDDDSGMEAGFRHSSSNMCSALEAKIAQADFLAAAQILQSPEAARALNPEDFDDYRAEIVGGLYLQKHEAEAAALAELGLGRDKPLTPSAAWAAGLTAFRLKHYGEAAQRFEGIAKSEHVDNWTRAAGAYWAARGHFLAREPEQFSHWINIAANYPYTFYGILARRLAGMPLGFNWTPPTLTVEDVHQVTTLPAALRAVALVQVGQDLLAEQELRRINPASPAPAHALIAVAQRSDMPALSMQLAEQVLDPEGRHYDVALYPEPSWQPKGGFSVDRAFVLALIRQESKFSPTATSPAGARGLMQLMPGTARFMADGTRYGGMRQDLFDPQLNITIGQNYLSHLMTMDNVGENLFLLAAAYNGGPGNVARWRRERASNDDPLLFIESIPNRETRRFVERVLANYWIYADELGYGSASLDAVAEGKWPIYQPSDGHIAPAIARYGRN
jgi:soluble lytic murein transglycosylase